MTLPAQQFGAGPPSAGRGDESHSAGGVARGTMNDMSGGRTALITGGTGGLGAATVTAFVADGWRVVAPVRPGRADRLPKGAVPVDGDMSDESDVTAAVAAASADSEAPLRAVINLIGGF